MSKWHSLLEYFQFPLKVLFFATAMLGIGSFIANPNLNLITEMEPTILYNISNILKYIGGLVINLFPFLVFIKILGKKFVDTPPIIIGIVTYMMILVVVMILQNNEAPVYFYNSVFNIEIQATSEVTKMMAPLQAPYHMGIIPMVLAYYVTKFAYRRSRHHIRHGLFYFIDHDSWACIISIIVSVVAALGLAFVWPFVIMGMTQLIDYIAADILSPLRLFVFGIVDRVSAILNISDIFRNVFWLSEAGGSWIDNLGNTFVGDTAIWQVIKGMDDVNVNAGQFTSAYYIINIFIIPAFLIAYYRLMGKKDNKKKYLLFIIVACILSAVSGNPLPIELCMLILSPLLYVVYLFLVGLTFALMTSLEVFIGFSFDGSLISSIPGNIVDLAAYLQYPQYIQPITVLILSGIIMGVIFHFATIFYFKNAAIGLLSVQSSEEIANLVIDAMGGVDNIIDVDATPDKLVASFKSRDEVDLEDLKELGAYLILESKAGYTIRLGNISIMVCEEIKQILKDKN